jgi:hypothetical protein
LAIGVLAAATVALAVFGWQQQSELDRLEANLSSPGCYTAFGNVYQQCLVEWMPGYVGGGE